MIDRLLLRKLLRTRLRLLHLNLLPESHSMSVPNSIHDYLRMFACELGERILQSFPRCTMHTIRYRHGCLHAHPSITAV